MGVRESDWRRRAPRCLQLQADRAPSSLCRKLPVWLETDTQHTDRHLPPEPGSVRQASPRPPGARVLLGVVPAPLWEMADGVAQLSSLQSF